MTKRGKRQSRDKRNTQAQSRGDVIDLEISELAHGGRGLGWHHGKPVFVPYTLPGEAITAEITGGRKNVTFARGLRLTTASGDRVVPSCPHFGPGQCWGCQWQHIDYPAQLLLKQDIVADQLSRQGKLPDKLIDSALRSPLPATSLWQYNHTLSLLRDESGSWGLRRDGGGIQAIGECHIAHPALLDLLARIDFDYHFARRLTLRRGTDGRLMLILEVKAEKAPELRADIPLSVNLILPDREPVNLIGDAHSHFDVAGRRFRVTAGAYIRPSVDGIERLVAEVQRALQLPGGGRALDLYAGVGVYSAIIAAGAELVTLVESYPPAANDADSNLKDFDNIDVIEGAVETVLAELADADARYDAAVVDPPPAGVSRDVIDGLARLEVERLVYVSGDPASLARDCQPLLSAGYHLRAVQPIDTAPHTFYITCVARFERQPMSA